MERMAVLTSGGDSPGMNQAVRALAKIGAARNVRVVGVELGYEGLMNGRFRDLTTVANGGVRPDPELEPMVSLGGTVLGSARSQRFRTEEGRAAAAKQLAGFDGLVVIGGNGSLAGAHALAVEHGVRVAGIPASIDHDIGCTGSAIGVDTALNTIVDACDRISDTARAHRRAFIVEVMGRESGYLAMASAVAAGADAVLFREQGRSDDDVIAAVEEAIVRGFDHGKKRVLIIKSEGVRLGCTALVEALVPRVHTRLPGAEVRATVLGHLVRGGSPSYLDRMIASRLAFGAFEALASGTTDVMAAWQAPVKGGTATADPHVKLFPLSEVLDETQRLLDGTSDVTKWRVKMMERISGVLGL